MKLEFNYARYAGRYDVKSAEHDGYHHDKTHGAFYARVKQRSGHGQTVGYVHHDGAQDEGYTCSQPQTGYVLVVKSRGLVRRHLLAELLRFIARLAQCHLTLLYLHCDERESGDDRHGDGFAERLGFSASFFPFRRLRLYNGVIRIGRVFILGAFLYARALVQIGLRLFLIILKADPGMLRDILGL